MLPRPRSVVFPSRHGWAARSRSLQCLTDLRTICFDRIEDADAGLLSLSLSGRAPCDRLPLTLLWPACNRLKQRENEGLLTSQAEAPATKREPLPPALCWLQHTLVCYAAPSSSVAWILLGCGVSHFRYVLDMDTVQIYFGYISNYIKKNQIHISLDTYIRYVWTR